MTTKDKIFKVILELFFGLILVISLLSLPMAALAGNQAFFSMFIFVIVSFVGLMETVARYQVQTNKPIDPHYKKINIGRSFFLFLIISLIVSAVLYIFSYFFIFTIR